MHPGAKKRIMINQINQPKEIEMTEEEKTQIFTIPYAQQRAQEADLEIRLHVVDGRTKSNPNAAPYIVSEQDGVYTSAFADAVEPYLEQLAETGASVPRDVSDVLRQEPQVNAMTAHYGTRTFGLVERIKLQTQGYQNPAPEDKTMVDIDVPIYVDVTQQEASGPIRKVPTPPPPLPPDVTGEVTAPLRPPKRAAAGYTS
jgi:hypothetical protein